WVKMGPEGVKVCLASGANDLGGTLMNETITRSAGAAHGQEMTPAAMEAIIRSLDRKPRQRTTLYTNAPEERYLASLSPVSGDTKTETQAAFDGAGAHRISTRAGSQLHS